jgi:hypothetical protein
MVFVAIIGTIGYQFLPPIPLPETETHGWLIPGHEPTPANACDRVQQSMPAAALLVLFGGTAFWSSTDVIRVVVGDCTIVEIERTSKGILIVSDVFTEDGKLVAHIKKNEFHLVPGQMSYPERSQDRSTLTVYDIKGHEIFYVRYTNAHTVVVRGVFFCSQMSLATGKADEIVFIPKLGQRIQFGGGCMRGSFRGIRFKPCNSSDSKCGTMKHA